MFNQPCFSSPELIEFGAGFFCNMDAIPDTQPTVSKQ